MGVLVTKPISVLFQVEIIPSVLPADWANMGAECKKLEDAGVDRIQFDVMDGNFVPNLTFGPEMIAACRKYCGTPFETQVSRPAEPPAAGARRAPFGLTRPRPRRRS